MVGTAKCGTVRVMVRFVSCSCCVRRCAFRAWAHAPGDDVVSSGPLLRQVALATAHAYLTLAKLSVLAGRLGRAVRLCIQAYYCVGSGRMDAVPGMLTMPLSSLVRAVVGLL